MAAHLLWALWWTPATEPISRVIMLISQTAIIHLLTKVDGVAPRLPHTVSALIVAGVPMVSPVAIGLQGQHLNLAVGLCFIGGVMLALWIRNRPVSPWCLVPLLWHPAASSVALALSDDYKRMVMRLFTHPQPDLILAAATTLLLMVIPLCQPLRRRPLDIVLLAALWMTWIWCAGYTLHHTMWQTLRWYLPI